MKAFLRSLVAWRMILLILTLCVVATVTGRQGSGPWIQPGQEGIVPWLAFEAKPKGLNAWEVDNAAGAVMGSNVSPNGWSVTLAGADLDVTVPSNATVAAGYMAYYQTATGPKPLWNNGAFNVGYPVPPPTPTIVTVTPGNQSVTLTWTPSPTASGYTVSRGTTQSDPYTSQFTTTNTTWSDTTVTNGVTYYYVIQATNNAGLSGYSNEVQATPNVIPPPPTNLVATPDNASVGFEA